MSLLAEQTYISQGHVLEITLAKKVTNWPQQFKNCIDQVILKSLTAYFFEQIILSVFGMI